MKQLVVAGYSVWLSACACFPRAFARARRLRSRSTDPSPRCKHTSQLTVTHRLFTNTMYNVLHALRPAATYPLIAPPPHPSHPRKRLTYPHLPSSFIRSLVLLLSITLKLTMSMRWMRACIVMPRLTRSLGSLTSLSLRSRSAMKPRTPLSSCTVTPVGSPTHSCASKWFHTCACAHIRTRDGCTGRQGVRRRSTSRHHFNRAFYKFAAAIFTRSIAESVASHG